MSDSFGPSWTQLHIVPPAIYECRLRIGTIPSVDHAQIQYEVWDPSSKALHAMASCPAMGIGDVERLAPEWLDLLLVALEDAGGLPGPFPTAPPD